MRHRLPRPSLSTKARGGLDGLSARLARRAGLMLALTCAVAITACAALVLPARPGAPAQAAMPVLAVAAASGKATPAAHTMRRTPSPVTAAPAGATTSAPASSATAVRHADPQRHKPAGGAPVNASCSLSVPADPTSATGLATPYRLTATDRQAGPCHEANADQSAFVEAAVLNLDSGAVGIYHPLVVDSGSTPAFAPVPISLPLHNVVGIWFGFNGDTLKLTGPGATTCVNGLGGSLFGQFAYCNALAFFAEANTAIRSGKLVVPPLGSGTDGLPCPTTRDFSVVDQDQSDNLATSYRVVRGRMAQDIRAAGAGTKLSNGSDEGLLAKAIDPALGCTPWTAPDLTTGSATVVPALALNELSAAARQAAPMALVPTSDPMVLVRGHTSVAKTNLYRAGVDMPAVTAAQTSQAYCTSLEQTAPQRLAGALGQLKGAPAPAGNPGTLYAFLHSRYRSTLQLLGCAAVK
jgi:hypothetical protein